MRSLTPPLCTHQGSGWRCLPPRPSTSHCPRQAETRHWCTHTCLVKVTYAHRKQKITPRTAADSAKAQGAKEHGSALTPRLSPHMKARIDTRTRRTFTTARMKQTPLNDLTSPTSELDRQGSPHRTDNTTDVTKGTPCTRIHNHTLTESHACNKDPHPGGRCSRWGMCLQAAQRSPDSHLGLPNQEVSDGHGCAGGNAQESHHAKHTSTKLKS